MKGFASILLLSFYVAVTGGMVVHKHYCSGELESSTLFFGKTCCCGGEKPSDCCSGEKAIFQLDTDGIVLDYRVEQPTCDFLLVHQPALAVRVLTMRQVYLPQLYIPPGWNPDIRVTQQRFNL